MEINEFFPRTRYATDVLEELVSAFLDEVTAQSEPHYISTLEVKVGNRSWSYDTFDEFFAEHRRKSDSYTLHVLGGSSDSGLQVWQSSQHGTHLIVRSHNREYLLKISDILTKHAEANRIPLPPAPVPPKPTPPLIFIGHGHDPAWRDLKDHLQDQHGYDVEAFESGARAGHTARDVLESMMVRSSFALIVLTAEDQMADGEYHARQNVVHEIGLFQGKLGFKRAIAVVEDDVELFSNLDGIQQIRFNRGNIRSTFGDVLATLRREFGAPPAD
jgi:predicted nucleotide-binding protein